MKSKYYFLFLMTALFLTACGGSSSSTAPPVNVTPPPPTNNAPMAVLTVDKSSLDEGQTFTLDASASTDSDGDSLTYVWIQKSGTPVDRRGATGSTISLNAAEVSTDELASFEVQVSDGRDISVASIDVEFLNIVQEPLEDFEYNKFSDLIVDQPIYEFVSKPGRFVEEKGIDGNIALLGTSPDDDLPIEYFTLFSSFGSSQVDVLTTRPFPRSFLRPHNIRTREDRARVIIQDEDIIIDYSGYPESTEEVSSLAIEKPCLAAEFINPPGSGLAPGGYTVFFQNQDLARVYYYLGEYSALAPLSELTPFSSIQENFCNDKEKGERTNVRFDFSGFRVVDKFSIDAMIENPDLKLIDEAEFGFEHQIILLSDGNHVGDHRLIWMRNDRSRGGGYSQIELTRWQVGAPTAMTILNEKPEFVSYTIVTPDTPNFRVYKDVQKPFAREFIEFPAPVFQNVGFGAYDVYPFPLFVEGNVAINFRHKKTLSFYEPK